MLSGWAVGISGPGRGDGYDGLQSIRIRSESDLDETNPNTEYRLKCREDRKSEGGTASVRPPLLRVRKPVGTEPDPPGNGYEGSGRLKEGWRDGLRAVRLDCRPPGSFE